MVMTRKSKRELERVLERIRGGLTGDRELHITSDVVTVTEDMVDDGEPLPDPEPPDGYEPARELSTESPVVSWYEYAPVADTDQ